MGSNPEAWGSRTSARAAGVSTTTVSHALSGKGRLPEETRARVRRIAEEMGYRPSRGGAKPRGRTHRACWASRSPCRIPLSARTSSTSRWYTRHRERAPPQRAMHAGYALVVVPPAAGPARSGGGCRWTAAIVVEPIARRSEPRSRSPRTACGSSRSVRPPGRAMGGTVDNDNGAVVSEALEHLRARGARRVALASFALAHAVARRSHRHLSRWCAERGAEPSVVASCRARASSPWPDGRLLDGPGGRDAVFCTVSSASASELLDAARDRGIRVPEDLLHRRRERRGARTRPTRPSPRSTSIPARSAPRRRRPCRARRGPRTARARHAACRRASWCADPARPPVDLRVPDDRPDAGGPCHPPVLAFARFPYTAGRPSSLLLPLNEGAV